MKSDNAYAYLKGGDLYGVNEAIAAIAKGGKDEDMERWVYDVLLLRISQGKSEVVLNAVLDSSELTDKQKKLVLDRISNKDLDLVFFDHIVSRISEMNTGAGTEDLKLSKLISSVVQEHKTYSGTGTDTRLTRVMILAHGMDITQDRSRSVEPSSSDPFTQSLIESVKDYKEALGLESSSPTIAEFDGQEQALAVQNYAKLETDQQKREHFATKQLNKYVEGLDVTNLNTAEKEKISKALTAIMEPICSPKEKAGLKNSVDKLVRECSQHAGEKKSFKQAWRDNIVEPIKRLLGRENVLQSFEKEAKTIGQSINKKTTSFAVQENAKKAAASNSKPAAER
jgi:hypothetical protein